MAGTGETPQTKMIFVINEWNTAWDDLDKMIADMRKWDPPVPEEELDGLREAFGGDEDYDSTEIEVDGNTLEVTKEQMIPASTRGGVRAGTGEMPDDLLIYELAGRVVAPGETPLPPPPATAWDFDDEDDHPVPERAGREQASRFYESLDDLLRMEAVRTPKSDLSFWNNFRGELGMTGDTLTEVVPIASPKYHYPYIAPHFYFPKPAGGRRKKTRRSKRKSRKNRR